MAHSKENISLIVPTRLSNVCENEPCRIVCARLISGRLMTTGNFSEKDILAFFKKFDLPVEQKDDRQKKTEPWEATDWPVGQYRNAGSSSASGSAGTAISNVKDSYGRLE